MSNRSIIIVILLAVAAFLVTQTFYTVDPTKQVLVRQFGAIVGDPKTQPGLYAKVPLIQDIQRIDRRLLDYEAEEFEIIAGDQKRLVVDAYARYKIVAAKLYAQTVPGGETTLRGLLDSLINSEIRGVLSSVPMHAVLTDQRANLMDEITKRVNGKTMELGVQTVDVRIDSADDIAHLPTLLQRRACRGNGCCANHRRCAACVGNSASACSWCRGRMDVGRGSHGWMVERPCHGETRCGCAHQY